MGDNVIIGTVTQYQDGKLWVRIDGMGAGDSVRCMRAVGYTPQVGDRVKLARIAGQYIVEYAVMGG